MKKKISSFGLILVLLVLPVGLLFSAVQEGNTTIGGVNGYITLPSALPVDSSSGHPTITTGYTAIFSLQDGFAHIPFIQFGFASDFEASLAFDIEKDFDLLLAGKWRFVEKNNTSVSFGFIGQALHLGNKASFAAQTYFASSFSSVFVSWPSKTTLLIGYTFDDSLNSDIDFGVGFQTPLWPKGFKDKVDFLIDFGNVSYSTNPSGGDANNRGLLNIGVRLLPLEFMRSTFITADLRLIDLFDHSGRALSVGIALSFKP